MKHIGFYHFLPLFTNFYTFSDVYFGLKSHHYIIHTRISHSTTARRGAATHRGSGCGSNGRSEVQPQIWGGMGVGVGVSGNRLPKNKNKKKKITTRRFVCVRG